MKEIINNGENFTLSIIAGNKEIKYTFKSLFDGLKVSDFSRLILLYGLSWEQNPYKLYIIDYYLNENNKAVSFYIAELVTVEEIRNSTFKGVLAGRESIPGFKNV